MLMACHLLYFIRQSKKSMKNKMIIVCVLLSDYVKLQELSEKKSALETQLEEKMERWVYLNDLAERIANGEMV